MTDYFDDARHADFNPKFRMGISKTG